jgi:acyl-CoA dehydrogenase
MIGATDSALFGSEDIVDVSREAIGVDADGRLADPVLRGQIGDFLVDEIAFDAELARAKTWMRAGNQLGAQSATLKYTGTELNKRRQELIMAAGGLAALEWDFENAAGDEKASLWLRSKGNSIEGGTSEVMLSILSKAILELG